MDFGILPELTKPYILSKITQEQIFEYYLNVRVEPEKLIKVPTILRIDKNPTASFYYNVNGKLRFNDFGGSFHGDCFDLVGQLFSHDSTSKRGFVQILDKIAKDFSIHKYSSDYKQAHKINLETNLETIKVLSKKKIDINSRRFNERDAKYWLQGNIKKKELDKYHVRPCENIWLNDKLIYNYSIYDPAYAAYFGKDENGIHNFRIYFPYRKDYRFISNCSPIQGYKQLEPDYIGIVTKSYKDVMSLNSFGIQSVSPSSESVLIPKNDWFNLKYTCSHWFSLMDYDRQGILMSKKLRDNYNIQPLFFSREFKDGNKFRKSDYRKFPLLYNNYEDHGVKDFFEFVSKIGPDKVKDTIIKTKEIFQERLETIDNQINTNLKFLKYDY